MENKPVFGGQFKTQYLYDSRHFANFKAQIKFINAEWGVEIELIPAESTF